MFIYVKVTAIGLRLCNYLKSQSDANVAVMMKTIGSFTSSMPRSCMHNLWTKKPMEATDIMDVARSGVVDASAVGRFQLMS